MGGVSPVLYRLLYRQDLPKYPRFVQISARAYIFTISWEKVKNLSRLLSVLSLHRKFVQDHKSCPDSAATLLSSQMEAILIFSRGRQKWLVSSIGEYKGGGGGGLDKRRSPCAGYKARSSLRLYSCWPHSRLSVECLFSLLPPFSVSRGAVQ
jgi:hypothetical protein